MKTLNLSKKILVFLLLWTSVTWSGNPVYSDLVMKDYDEMLSEVKNYVNEAESIGNDDIDGAKIKLRDALQLILSRPNLDNMVSKLVPYVRTPLRNIEVYEDTLKEIVQSAIVVANDKNATAKEQATAIIILDNFLSEFQPEVKIVSKDKNQILSFYEMIRDAKIEVSSKVKSEFRSRGSLKTPLSPSDTAKKILTPNKK